MAVVVTLNDKEFNKKLVKINKSYRFKILKALSDGIDRIRTRSADEFIIARQGPLTTPFKMQKVQKVDRTRLTERTGLLRRILKGGNIEIGKTARLAKIQGNQFLNISVKVKKTESSEIYEGKIGFRPKGNVAVKFRILHETRGSRSGTIRRFLGPAVEAEEFNLEKLIDERTQAERNAKL